MRIAAAALLFALPGCATSTIDPSVVERTIDVGGSRMFAAVHPGARGGPVIVLEAGATLDSTEWNGVIAALRGRTDATIIAYDRAGMGRSAALSAGYDIRDEVSRLHALLRRLGHDRRMLLVGHSYGGYLMQAYANMYPDEVIGLVYVEANTVEGIGGPEGAGELIRSILKADAEGEIRFNDMRLARAYVETTRKMADLPPPCGVPVTVVTRGAVDLPVTGAEKRWRDGHAALAARTGGTLIHASGAGHMIPTERPRLVADAILATLARVPERTARLTFPPAGVGCAARE